MTHIRKQVRDAAVAALTGLVTTGANVFSGRLSPFNDDEYPGLVVFLNADNAAPDGWFGGPTETHSGDLVVEGVAQGNDELIDTLDQISLEVEVALFGAAGESFRALLMGGDMLMPPDARISIEEPDANGGARRQGSVSLRFPITYRTVFGDPGAVPTAESYVPALNFSVVNNSMYVPLI